MTPFRLIESTIESAALEWLGDLGWRVAHGPDITPGMPGASDDPFLRLKWHCRRTAPPSDGRRAMR